MWFNRFFNCSITEAVDTTTLDAETLDAATSHVEETPRADAAREGMAGETVATMLGSIFLGLAAGGAAIYALVLRPRMLQWGTSSVEQVAPLPGDEIVSEPRHMWTRAVTIQAPPAAVWPWLVQMGQGRGGLYSYDWLENLIGCDIHSVSEIVPELQNLAVGDEIRLVKPDYSVDLALTVARLEPEAALVLHPKDDMETAFAAGLPYMSWAFVLHPSADGGTRLLVRTRSTYAPTLAALFWNRYFLEPIQFIMERKMMLGIRDRAEQAYRGQQPAGNSETLLDDILPDYTFRGVVTMPINASAAAIFQAFENVTLADMPLARALGELRYLPARLMGTSSPSGTDNRPFYLIIQESGNIILAEVPDQEIVIGAAGKFHQLTNQEMVHFDTPEQFHQFQDSAYQKLVQSIRVTPNPNASGYLLTLEHRTQGLSDGSRRAFAPYWLVIRPMGNFVSRLLLQAVKARAEQAAARAQVKPG